MKKFVVLFISIACLGAAFLLNSASHKLTSDSSYVRGFRKELQKKKELTLEMFDRLKDADLEEVESVCDESRKEGIILLKYQSDSLVFWSSNSIPIYDFISDQDYKNRIDTLNNSYYYVVQSVSDSCRCIGFINIYNNYAYDNEFLVSGFNPDFKIHRDDNIGFDTEQGIKVEEEGEYLFSIILDNDHKIVQSRAIVASVLLILGLILLMTFILFFIRTLRGTYKIIAWILVLIVYILRFMQLQHTVTFADFLIFDPIIYADSILSPNLGALIINSIMIFFGVIIITYGEKHREKTWLGQRSGSIPAWMSEPRLLRTVMLILGFLLFYILLLYAHYHSKSLIFNSSISFQPGANSQLTVYSFIGYAINGLNYLSAGLVLIWIIRNLFVRRSFVWYLVTYLIFGFVSNAIFLIQFLLWDYSLDLITVVFVNLFIWVVLIMQFFRRDLSAYSSLVLFLLLYSVYAYAFIVKKNEVKNVEREKSLAFSLANEHDPDAESKFEDLSEGIWEDDYINSRVQVGQIDADSLWTHLKNNYFSGFWNKYELVVTLCRPIDSIGYQCYNDFDRIIDEEGFILPDSRFYYLSRSVRISYLGRFIFNNFSGNEEISLYIELNLRSDDFFGYPELLLNKRKAEDKLLQGYSYAKYQRGNLVSKSGDFSYSLTTDLFGDLPDEYNSVALNDYNHLLYQSDDESIIVLSSPRIKFIDMLVGFSYIFVFYYLCLIVILGGKNIIASNFRILMRLRSKIQFAILSILVISLILIAGSTVWLNLRTYKQRQNDNLKEKVKSVLIELKHKLAQEEELTPDWSAENYANLDRLLIKFSDVFYTDINLYDLNGNLLATSRSEIFNLGLQGEKIDPIAYVKLNQEKRAQYIHPEKIGELEYLSAYVPFENADGKKLAYLNLPYFTRQTELQASLSTLILTIVNIYVILILLTIVVTLFISEQITRPLAMLQLKFRELKIGDKYEQISYKKEDEIGSLVKEYNRMVLELERSINLLARSERESAWREMAKQIAHEIKNPLTPMRLSVQQLNKIWADRKEDFNEHLENVTATLIEQIDNLSAIASEFSNFAKMPVAKFEEVNVCDVMDKTVQLFKGDRVQINFRTKDRDIIARADREQLSRVFINLIKNGIQSIPDEKEGIIHIDIQKEERTVCIVFRDNGRGIPDEIKSKLFMPNFTTKSGGMGLGLAIVKNVIDQMGGEINFETRIGKGSTFTIRLPLQ